MNSRKIFRVLMLQIVVAGLTFIQGSTALRLQRIVVPAYKMRGETAVLECHYELDGDLLYAVKWYKENEEFYRYVPRSNPPQYSYKVEGIKVDHSYSDNNRVFLKSINLRTSGLYRCEVSAEAPSFSSAQREARMEVVCLPKDGPHITGEKEHYQIGDYINLNCSSGKSYPTSHLQWFINDNLAPDWALLKYPTHIHHHGLITSELGLFMPLSSNHFVNGSLKVRCVATLSPPYWKGDRESTFQKIDNREKMLLVKSSTSVRVNPSVMLTFAILIPFVSLVDNY